MTEEELNKVQDDFDKIVDRKTAKNVIPPVDNRPEPPKEAVKSLEEDLADFSHNVQD